MYYYTKVRMSSQLATEIMSFYIPYIPNKYSEEDIKHLFRYSNVGVVERVDFIPPPPQEAGGWTWARPAFVHLKEWYYNNYTHYIYKELTDRNSGKVRLYLDEKGYFTLKKMTTPKIPTTELNIHQLADKLDKVEKELVQLNIVLSTATSLLNDDDNDKERTFVDKKTSVLDNYPADTWECSIPSEEWGSGAKGFDEDEIGTKHFDYDTRGMDPDLEYPDAEFIKSMMDYDKNCEEEDVFDDDNDSEPSEYYDCEALTQLYKDTLFDDSTRHCYINSNGKKND